MALGADAGKSIQQVVRQGMRLAVAGVTFGVAAALAATRLLTSLLFGVSPLDP